MAFAERSFFLGQVQEGRSRRDRLETRLDRAIRKGRDDIAAAIEAELATPPFPVALSYVWNAWIRIRRRKGVGFSGPVPIEWTDIDAFLRRSDVQLTSFEVGFIERIDDVYMASFNEGPSPSEAKLAVQDSVDRISKKNPDQGRG